MIWANAEALASAQKRALTRLEDHLRIVPQQTFMPTPGETRLRTHESLQAQRLTDFMVEFRLSMRTTSVFAVNVPKNARPTTSRFGTKRNGHRRLTFEFFCMHVFLETGRQRRLEQEIDRTSLLVEPAKNAEHWCESEGHHLTQTMRSHSVQASSAQHDVAGCRRTEIGPNGITSRGIHVENSHALGTHVGSSKQRQPAQTGGGGNQGSAS